MSAQDDLATLMGKGGASRREREAALARVESRLARLEEGLRWYAERRNYLPPAGTRFDGPAERWIFTQDAFDGEGPGARARSLLADQGGAAETSSAYGNREPDSGREGSGSVRSQSTRIPDPWAEATGADQGGAASRDHQGDYYPDGAA